VRVLHELLHYAEALGHRGAYVAAIFITKLAAAAF
jgi:hypothetical protein